MESKGLPPKTILECRFNKTTHHHPPAAQPPPLAPVTCTIPLPNLDLLRAGRNTPWATRGLVRDPRLWPCQMQIRGLASCAWHILTWGARG